MANIKQILVSSERLLAKLEAEFPQLRKVSLMIAGSAVTGITSAGTNFTLSHIHTSAKKHDPEADYHAVEYHPEPK